MRARDLLLVYAAGLVVYGAVALLIREPGTIVDAHYAFNGGRLIAAGEGFTAPYIWNWVNPPEALPAPSYRYWQPLPAMLSAMGITLLPFRDFGAAQVPFTLVGALMPVLAYIAAYRLSGERMQAWTAALLTVFGGFYVRYWSLPETFTPFGVAGAAALLLISGERPPRWAWPLAGALAGLAHLARADGLLLLGVVGLMAGAPDRAEWRNPQAWFTGLPPRLLDGVLVVVGYLLVMGPWFARNVAAFGSWQAPGGLSTLWLLEYNDLFLVPAEFSAGRFFAAGPGPILAARVQGVAGNLATFLGVHCMVFLLPPLIVGWREYRRDLFPVLLYGVLLFIVMSLLFTWQGVRGGWLHSAAALVPFVIAASAAGLDRIAAWLAARDRRLRLTTARDLLRGAAVGLALLVTVFLTLRDVVGFADLSVVAWNQTAEQERWAAEELAALGAQGLVVSNSPPRLYTYAGLGGVPLPNGDEADLLRMADAYGADYVVLGPANSATPLGTLYREGPQSGRLEQVAVRPGDEPVYLYRVIPP